MAPTDDDVTQALRPITIHDDLVTRPASAWTPTVHSFLRHLRSNGFMSSPEPLGIDGGAESLRLIEGDSGGDDVAYALRWFAPARDDEMARTWHHFPTVLDRVERVHSFLDAYGGLPPFDVAEAVAIRMEATMTIELSLAEAGVEPQRTWVADGSQAWAAGEVQWVRDNAHLLNP